LRILLHSKFHLSPYVLVLALINVFCVIPECFCRGSMGLRGVLAECQIKAFGHDDSWDTGNNRKTNLRVIGRASVIKMMIGMGN
jgi:hypothetical protein